MTRVLCARFPHLGLLAAWGRHPELRGEPVVVGGAPALRLPVVAASPAARAGGVRPGQPLRQAQQLCPAAVFVPLDGEAVEHLRDRALAALCTAVPSAEIGDDEAYADLGGRHAAHPSEPAWAAAAARALAAGLGGEAPAVGVAASRLVARIAAGRSVPHRVRRVREGEEAAFLAALPVGVLPVDPALVARLATMGIDRVGQVAALAPADLGRQFGPEGIAAHRLARGLGGGGVHPVAPPRAAVERLVLDGATADLETLRRAARHLCDTLGGRLLAGGVAAARVTVTLEGEAGPAGTGTRVPPVPAAAPAELWPAVLGCLGSAVLVAPVVAVRVDAAGLEPVAGRQVDLLQRGDAERDDVERAVARLHDRFGTAAVLRPRLADDPGDLPERRFSWVVAGARTAATVATGGTAGLLVAAEGPATRWASPPARSTARMPPPPAREAQP